RSDFRTRRGSTDRQPYPRAMRLHRIASVVFASVVFVSLAGSSRGEDAASAPRESHILAHAITIRFEPETHSFVACDVLTLDAPGRVGARLAPNTTVDLSNLEHALLLQAGRRSVAEAPGDAVFAFVASSASATVNYHGTIFDGVDKKEGLAWVAGDRTRG